MKKKGFILLVMMLAFIVGRSQSLSKATVTIDKVDISNINIGEEIVVPIRLIDKTDLKITGFQIFIEFDHNILNWKGTWENPLPGIKEIHKNTPYVESDWLFNDNSNQLVAIWSDPNFNGVDIGKNEIFFEIVFIYKGGLEKDYESPLTWGDKYEQKEGIVVRGPTELYDEDLQKFDVTLINGAISNK